MAFDTVTAGMAPDTELDDGCRIVFEAIDPGTGNPVTGVVVTSAGVYVDDVTPALPLPDALPLLTPLQLEEAGG